MQGIPPQVAPLVLVVPESVKREQGRKVQLMNIAGARAVANVVRSSIGPLAMLKMILDPMGGTHVTSDGNAILRELEVTSPAAKTIIEISQTQDREVGDGTTSVVILAGELMSASEQLLEQGGLHPTAIVGGFASALEDMLRMADDISSSFDFDNEEQVMKVIKSCLGTKFSAQYADMLIQLAYRSLRTVSVVLEDGRRDIDTKRFVRIEKIPGGDIFDSKVVAGIMIEKDVIHPSMARKVLSPRVVCLDCGLEYKKLETQATMEIRDDADFEKLLEMEERWTEEMVNAILRVNPSVVVVEKGVSDYAAHLFKKAKVSVLRRLKGMDNDRIARATGATVVHNPRDITEKDVGTKCGRFIIRKLVDQYFSFFEECKDNKACTVVLRGPSKDYLNEVERNLHDAMAVTRLIAMNPRVVTGAGSFEIALARGLRAKAAGSLTGSSQLVYEAVADSLEVIVKCLAENCGANVIRTLTEIKSRQTAEKNSHIGIDGVSGKVVDLSAEKYGLWEPVLVKTQTLKSSIEAASALVRVDEVILGAKAPGNDRAAQRQAPQQNPEEAIAEAEQKE